MHRVGFLLLALATISHTAAAQQANSAAGWSSKPLRLIAPFPAASTADVIGRILGQKLSERLGQQFVIENRVGGSGSAGMEALAKAAPDGYTFGIVTPSIAIQTTKSSTLDPMLDPTKRFTPIAMIARSPLVLVVYPGLPVNSVSDLVALAKSKPGVLNFSSAGPASIAHVAGALFANMSQIQLTHVPYKSTAQSVIDLISGRVELQFATIAPSLASIRSGQLRALAVTSTKRVAALPSVPTMEEGGIRGYESTLWFALVGPAGLNRSIADRLNHEITQILGSEEMEQTLAKQGFDASPGPREAVTAQIAGDVAIWEKISPEAGLTSD
jgi:tripartite-type tricarboxylate transporter receptor subunit TctC